MRLVRVRVPLLAVHRSARGVQAVRDSVLVCWTRPDGIQGWAECPTLDSPGYATETTAQAWAAMVTQLGPAAIGGRTTMSSGVVAASSALADAELDAELRAAGRSLVDHLGAERRPLDRSAVLAGVGDRPDVLAARAVDAVAGGAAMVKVKVSPGHDVEVVRAVIDAVAGTPVAADANGSYPDLHALSVLDGLGLAYLEQPLAAGTTWDDLARVGDRLVTPIALDESLTSVDAVQAALTAGAAGVVSIKPSRLGGVTAASQAVALARSAGVPAFVGGMFELGIGRAAASAVAALAGCELPTDLGPSHAYVAHDVCEPVTVDGRGRLLIPDGNGCGRRPDPERLERFSVDEVLLGR